MSVLIVQSMPAGFDTDTYDQISAKARVNAEPPKGMIFHALGTSDRGQVIVDVWESEEAFDDFREGRLNPAMESIVGSEAFAAMPTPERQFYGVHNIMNS